ncbi:MAG TPA: TonB-dependent receptor [Gemmatimonadaceae bacterium]|nr:TonB-dependent receptor [Gemmatimonadaceae bacterium]
MLRIGVRWATFVVLLALYAATAAAQVPSGRIAGTVRDAFGAPREGARVTAIHSVTGTLRSSLTSADGSYVIPELAPGTYTVSASLIGFRRATRTGIEVPGSGGLIDFTIEPLPLQSVTVTATLREQELQDVPFSIAAPTSDVLRERGAETIEDIAANVAGFTVQNLGPGQSQVAIRGASAGQVARDQPGVKEQVGAYLDDSPISLSLFTPDLDLFDLSRVEVLRGPQGTLFGAGSLSGTVRYITNQPELGIRSTFGEVGGNWIQGGNGGADVKVGTNVPLGDRAATRLVVYHNQLAGYMDAVQPDLGVKKNVNTGTRTGVRAAVRFGPADGSYSITPRLVFQTVRMDGWNRIDAFNILANPYTTTRPKVFLGERQQFTQIDEPFTDKFTLGDLNVHFNVGPGTLTSVTSYSNRDILVVRDAGALTSSITGGTIALPEDIYTLDSPLDDKTDARVVTQELRFGGGGEFARWLVGGFFSRSKRDYGQILTVGGFEAGTGSSTRGLRAGRDELFFSDLSYDLRQTALFGEATLGIGFADLTAGLRWYRFNEKRDQVFDGIFANDNTGTQLVSVPGKTSADGFAPRFIATLRPTPQITLNAQAAKGFRLGGINDPLNEPLCTAADLATFRGRDSWQDETAWNYEVGAKTNWMGGRVGLNASAFTMDIRDLQLIVTAGTCSSRLVFNVPKAVSQGAEIEFTAAPNQFVDFAVSSTFLKSELRSTLVTVASSGARSIVSGIKEGNRLPSVPKFQAAAAATLRRPMRSGAEGFFNVTFQHVGSRYTQIDDLDGVTGRVDMLTFRGTIGGPLTQQFFTFDPLLPAYSLVNTRLGLTRAMWEMAVFVNNVTDERAFLALDRERGTRARVGYLTNQPRTFGITLGFSY